jgi:hypothetical protein
MWAPELTRNLWQREKFRFSWIQTRDIQTVAWSLCNWPVSSLSLQQSHSFLGDEVKLSRYAMRAQGGRGSIITYLNPWRYYTAVHHRIHNNSPPARVLSQSNTIHSSHTHIQNLLTILSDLILPSTFCFSELSPSLWLSQQNLSHYSFLSHACHSPCPPLSPWLNLPNDIWRWVQIMYQITYPFSGAYVVPNNPAWSEDVRSVS